MFHSFVDWGTWLGIRPYRKMKYGSRLVLIKEVVRWRPWNLISKLSTLLNRILSSTPSTLPCLKPMTTPPTSPSLWSAWEVNWMTLRQWHGGTFSIIFELLHFVCTLYKSHKDFRKSYLKLSFIKKGGNSIESEQPALCNLLHKISAYIYTICTNLYKWNGVYLWSIVFCPPPPTSNHTQLWTFSLSICLYGSLYTVWSWTDWCTKCKVHYSVIFFPGLGGTGASTGKFAYPAIWLCPQCKSPTPHLTPSGTKNWPQKQVLPLFPPKKKQVLPLFPPPPQKKML